MQETLYAGLMSGTSIDGIDVALISCTSGQAPKLIDAIDYPWPHELEKQLRKLLADNSTSLPFIATIDALIAELFADAVLALLDKVQLNPCDICAIGSHGQTIWHSPDSKPAFTWQLGDPSRIAALTGITTVADFRRKDIAYGGQGAPLVPAFHQAVFMQAATKPYVLNIGGIANITLPGNSFKPLSGFDTGPGNCLMDAWINHSLQKKYDENGNWARQGKVNIELLEQLLNDSFFQTPPPKSTGTEYFSLQWLFKQLEIFNKDIAAVDVQANLLELSCQSIVRSINSSGISAKKLLICGGGVHNEQLTQRLQQLLPSLKIASTMEQGIDPDWVEAMAFAWLAQQTLAAQPGSLSSVTGASQDSILGGIYLA